jgi:hypothetical protein
MLRGLMALYMTVVLAAGPGLCCCSAARRTTGPAEQPAQAGCCACKSEQDAAEPTVPEIQPGVPGSPVGEHVCPCRVARASLVADPVKVEAQPVSPLSTDINSAPRVAPAIAPAFASFSPFFSVSCQSQHFRHCLRC